MLASILRITEHDMEKTFVRGTWQAKRAFSPAVITQGAGRMVFIAGHTGQADDSGKSLAGDFDAQFRQTFRNIEKTLAQAGASLRDMVTRSASLAPASASVFSILRKVCRHCASKSPASDLPASSTAPVWPASQRVLQAPSVTTTGV